MPCPFFEPRALATAPEHRTARLPLLDEYDGDCRSTSEAFPVPPPQRFRYCNHGYSRHSCEHFPAAETRSSFRYAVIRYSSTALEILCIEEHDYTPLRWFSTHYRFATGCLEPEIADLCMRAQALAFCHSYLERLPSAP
jgi:hypothetical protein